MNLEEFTKGLKDTGLNLPSDEAAAIFQQFDTDGSGSINMTEFLIGLRVSLRDTTCHGTKRALKR